MRHLAILQESHCMLVQLLLFKDYFPIGSGFASFASHISGKYFSGVYNVIHIAGLYSADGQISPDVGDAGIPYYLGQFGFIGMIFIGILIYMMIKNLLAQS